MLSATEEAPLASAAEEFTNELRKRLTRGKIDARILGPAQCQMYRLRGRYRRHTLVVVNGMQSFVDVLSQWEARQTRFGLPAAVRVSVDVDAYDFL